VWVIPTNSGVRIIVSYRKEEGERELKRDGLSDPLNYARFERLVIFGRPVTYPPNCLTTAMVESGMRRQWNWREVETSAEMTLTADSYTV
jgi:hypothetical protein